MTSEDDPFQFSWFDKERDQQASQELILSGLSEHWGDQMDASFNADVLDLWRSFSLDEQESARGWLLVAHSYVGDSLVLAGIGGMTAVQENETGDRTYELKRVSVKPEYRRRGLASMLVGKLEQQAMLCQAKGVFLETTFEWTGVVQFYLRCGYHPVLVLHGDLYLVKSFCSAAVDGAQEASELDGDDLGVLPTSICQHPDSQPISVAKVNQALLTEGS